MFGVPLLLLFSYLLSLIKFFKLKTAKTFFILSLILFFVFGGLSIKLFIPIVESGVFWNTEKLIEIGLEKEKLKDYKGAITDFTKAIELNPDIDIFYSYRGLSKQSLEDLDGACADWREAARLGDEKASEWVKNDCN